MMRTTKIFNFIFYLLSLALTSCGESKIEPLFTLIQRSKVEEKSKFLYQLKLETVRNYFYTGTDSIKLGINYLLLPVSTKQMIIMKNDRLFLVDSNYCTLLNFVPRFVDGKSYSGSFLNGILETNNLYLLDFNKEIKKLNLRDNLLSTIHLKNKTEINDRSNFFDIAVNDSGQIILTNQIIPSDEGTISNNGQTVARIINDDGTILNHFTIPHESIDSLKWYSSPDYPFCAIYNQKIYFSFVFSDKVYRFNEDGSFDKRFEINTGHEQSTLTLQQINKLQIVDGSIYYIANISDTTKPVVIRFDLDFNKIEELALNIPISRLGYKLYIVGNKLMVQSSGLFIYSF